MESRGLYSDFIIFFSGFWGFFVIITLLPANNPVRDVPAECKGGTLVVIERGRWWWWWWRRLVWRCVWNGPVIRDAAEEFFSRVTACCNILCEMLESRFLLSAAAHKCIYGLRVSASLYRRLNVAFLVALLFSQNALSRGEGSRRCPTLRLAQVRKAWWWTPPLLAVCTRSPLLVHFLLLLWHRIKTLMNL